MIYANDDFSQYKIAKRYYALAHFSKFIPQGSISLDTGFYASRGLNAFAFKRPDGKTVIVAVNDSRAKRVIEPDIEFNECKITVTNQENNLTEQEYNGKITLEPKSIATIILG